jgi:hypothetical protein
MAISNATTAARMLLHHELWLADMSISQVTSILQVPNAVSSSISCPVTGCQSHTFSMNIIYDLVY